jgi:hypothetical protein
MGATLATKDFRPQKLQLYWHLLHQQVIDFIEYFYKISVK